MCIIMAKPKGVEMPDDDAMYNMWIRNPDGAGFMYAKDGRVHIEKGFMKYELFKAALKKARKTVDFKNSAVVMHFRITTHGGTKPENCHPFPISDSIGKLKKLVQDTRIGVAHNGIIPSVTPRKDISDTMEYIATQIAPLYKGAPNFYKDANLMLMIQNATHSKLAFLTGEGKIYTVGSFINDHGRLYSNSSYEPWVYTKYSAMAWSDYYDDRDGTVSTYERLLPSNITRAQDYTYRTVEWLDDAEGTYVVSPDGTWYEAEDFAIDESDVVYLYSYDYDAFVPMPGYYAYTGNNQPYHFDDESTLVSSELIFLGELDDDAPWDDD